MHWPGAALVVLVLAADTLGAQPPGGRLTQRVSGTGIELTLVPIPGGTFRIGSPIEEKDRDDDEGPTRTVQVHSFWMTIHEITHDQFGPFRHRRLDSKEGSSAAIPFDADGVTRPSPPYEDPAHGMPKGDHPVVGMTRLAALRYAHWLSEKTGRLYRLPTEAEWEYACRAGGTTAFGFGDDPAVAPEHGWFDGNSGGTYHRVGLKAANRWGLYDLHGNVAEWVMDTYDPGAYAALPLRPPAVDPMLGDPTRGRGVVRGGAFDDPPARLRCAERFPEAAAWKRRDPQIPKSRWWNTDSPHVGFRLVSPARDQSVAEIAEYWRRVLGTTPRD